MNAHQQEKLFKSFQQLCSYHRGEIASAYIDWQVYTLYHPRYEQEYNQVVPLIVLDFAI